MQRLHPGKPEGSLLGPIPRQTALTHRYRRYSDLEAGSPEDDLCLQVHLPLT